MDFWKCAADSVTQAVNCVIDKSRRAALISRLKIVIRNEKEKQARAYIKLGKYYYETMRDSENGRTEPVCAAIDDSARRLKKACAKLDELIVSKGSPSAGAGRESADESGGKGVSSENGESGKKRPEPETPARQDPEPGKEEAASDDEDFLRPFAPGTDSESGSEEMGNRENAENPGPGKSTRSPEAPEKG